MQRDLAFIIDILNAAETAIRFKRKTSKLKFLKNELVQSGILHQLIVMGEAVKRLTPEFRHAHSEIPWKLIAGMRDRLTHGYFDVDFKEVWRTVETDIPSLICLLKPINQETLAKSKKNELEKKAHPWRPCPLGQHWVVTHPLHTPQSKINPEGNVPIRHGHCAENPSKKDHLYANDILEVSLRHFSNLQGPPKPDALGFKNGNKFDNLIRGWTLYWNEVLNPKDKLDPDLIKALIASESSFDTEASNHKKGKARARGLMQMLDGSVPLLSGNSKELKDNFVNLTRKDMENPTLAICAGIRWLFRKKQLAESKARKDVSWRDAIAKYKSYKPNDPNMKKFDIAFARLKGSVK